jgi:membrane protein DedA with SNARE-associated domain
MAYDEQGGNYDVTPSLNYTHYATIVYLELAVNVGIVVPEEALLPAVV